MLTEKKIIFKTGQTVKYIRTAKTVKTAKTAKTVRTAKTGSTFLRTRSNCGSQQVKDRTCGKTWTMLYIPTLEIFLKKKLIILLILVIVNPKCYWSLT